MKSRSIWNVRRSLSALGLAFTTYLAIGALIWTEPVVNAPLMLISVALYLVVSGLCIYWNGLPPSQRDASTESGGFGPGIALPFPAVVLVIATAVVVPNATWIGAGPVARYEPFATWSLGGIGALMAIVMIRHRPWVAWIGIVLLAVQSIFWIGVESSLALGLVGAVLWVMIAQIMTRLIGRAAQDTATLTRVQRAASERLAAQEAGRRERRVRVQHALATAGPVLSRVIETGGALTEEERLSARIAEGRLRDELRGGRLVDADVRDKIDQARERGAAVTVLDEGGLEDLDEQSLRGLRTQIADALEGAGSDRIYIRSSAHPDVAATIVGRSGESEDADEVVDLWHEIARPDPDHED